VSSSRRRTPRGATRPAPGPRRRSAQSHDRVNGRARAATSSRRPVSSGRIKVNPQAPRRNTDAQAPRPFLKTMTKLAARMVLGIVILAVFVFGVFPTGSYVEQRNELKDAEQELSELRGDNAELDARVERLGSDEEIERVAREEFDMVFPEEESYLILPPGE
jgi:cell division protein FtsB